MGYKDLIVDTIHLQKQTEEHILLAVTVLRGPDPRLRAEALEMLESLAETIGNSTARLEDLI